MTKRQNRTTLATAAQLPERIQYGSMGAYKGKPASRKQIAAHGKNAKEKRMLASFLSAEKPRPLDSARVIFTDGWKERWNNTQTRAA